MLGDIDQLTMEEMRWLMDVNLWGTVNITQALLPALRREPAAHITHLVSIYGLAAPAGRIPYAMSKYAVRGFTEALRHELEGSTVSVGAVYPAGVKTGIILHGRYAASLDPAVAQRAANAQAKMYHTEPADAARRIVDATVRRSARTMVGREARLVDVLTRVTPTRYWARDARDAARGDRHDDADLLARRPASASSGALRASTDPTRLSAVTPRESPRPPRPPWRPRGRRGARRGTRWPDRHRAAG